MRNRSVADLQTGIFKCVSDEDTVQIKLNSPEWLAWLIDDSSKSFRVLAKPINYSARKENQKTGSYWYAYVRHNKKLYKAYIGKSEMLTDALLKDTSIALSDRLADTQSSSTGSDSGKDSQSVPKAQDYKIPINQPDFQIHTKTQIPPNRPDTIIRFGLLDRMQAAIWRKLTVISTPAGYGKTTFLVQWASSTSFPVAWLSLDAGDNDLVGFIKHLRAALTVIAPDLPEYEIKFNSAADISNILTDIINHLSARPMHFAVVLDDYSIISEESVHHAVSFILEHAPVQMHMVLSSRGAPPFRLSLMRGRGELAEFHTEDLCFSLQEAFTFYNHLGIPIKEDDMAYLLEHTEGWAAGLRMAAIASIAGKNKFDFAKDFSGRNRNVADFLLDEVFINQPENIQTFLLGTSFLKRLSVALCDYVTKQDSSHKTLEYLENMCLFLSPMDTERHWYQYHALFADFLQQRSRSVSPSLEIEVYSLAAQWCSQNQLYDEAIEYALAAKEYDMAIHMLIQIAPNMLSNGQHYALTNWISSIPQKLVYSDPELCIWYATALVLGDMSHESGQRLHTAEEALSSASTNSQAPQIQGIRGHIALLQGDINVSLELVKNALAAAHEENFFLKGLLSLFLGESYYLTGNVKEAVKILKDAQRFSTLSDSPLIMQMASVILANVYINMSKLHDAYNLFLQMLENTTEHGKWPHESLAHLGIGTILLEWNELDAALYHAQRILDKESLEMIRIWAYQLIASVRQSKGQFNLAHVALDKADELSSALQRDDLVAANHAHQACLSITAGNLPQVLSWLKYANISLEDDLLSKKEFEYFTYARCLIFIGKARKSLPLLAKINKAAKKAGRVRSYINCCCIQALAYHAFGDSQHALLQFKEALSLAQPEGYVRVFLDESAPMAKLLQLAIDNEIEPDYAAFLLNMLGPDTLPDHTQSDTYINLLTNRELEILQLASTALTNAEIAAQLFITENTVKKHMSNIYSKLDVSSRLKAIMRCQKLGML